MKNLKFRSIEKHSASNKKFENLTYHVFQEKRTISVVSYFNLKASIEKIIIFPVALVLKVVNEGDQRVTLLLITLCNTEESFN